MRIEPSGFHLERSGIGATPPDRRPPGEGPLPLIECIGRYTELLRYFHVRQAEERELEGTRTERFFIDGRAPGAAFLLEFGERWPLALTWPLYSLCELGDATARLWQQFINPCGDVLTRPQPVPMSSRLVWGTFVPRRAVRLGRAFPDCERFREGLVAFISKRRHHSGSTVARTPSPYHNIGDLAYRRMFVTDFLPGYSMVGHRSGCLVRQLFGGLDRGGFLVGLYSRRARPVRVK
jgi:hypothetical protein